MILGRAVAALVLAMTLGPVVVVALHAGQGRGISAADLAAFRFTVLQAALSAIISATLAIPVARALARRSFPGRSALITLLGAPFLLPVVVAALGLVAVFGRSGWISDALALIGLPQVSIYGLHGVVLGHVFLNLPLATRMLLQGWQRVPAEQLRLAASLGVPVWRMVERPMLQRVLPGVVAVVFVLCLNSFAIALILGGGPRATTVELAIYQAMRFDFDLARAALLAAIQAALGLVAAIVLWRVSMPGPTGAGGMDRTVRRWDGSPFRDGLIIALAAAFLILPMSAILLDGIGGLGDMPASTWPALARSVAVALGAAVLCLGFALPIALSPGRLSAVAGLVPLSGSALVLGVGFFLVLRPYVGAGQMALPMTALVNALLALPFAVRVLAPAIAEVEAGFGRLSTQLGLVGWTRLRLVILPRIKAPLGFATGLVAALSMGDLGVIALFAGPGQETLPLTMYRLMGSYRTDAAAAVGLVLIASALALFWMFDRGGRRSAEI